MPTVGEVDIVARLVDKVSAKMDKIEKDTATSAGKQAKSWDRVNTAVSAIAFDRIADGLTELGDRADSVTKIRTSFDNLTASAGLAGDVLLDKVRAASQGLVTDFDLMASANQALTLGLVQSEEEFAALAESAIALGQAAGRTAKESIDDLVTGLGRQSTEVLDNLGIILKADDAYQTYAASIGKAAKDLTDAEKKTAFMAVGLERAGEAAQRVGGINVTAADQLTQFRNSMQNIIDSASDSLGPLATVGGGAADVASKAALIATAAPGAIDGLKGMAGASKLMSLSFLGPAGLIAAFGLLIAAIVNAQGKLKDLQDRMASFSALTEREMMRTITEVDKRIVGLRKDMEQYGDVLGETSTEIAELEAKKRDLIEQLNAHRRATEESTGEVERLEVRTMELRRVTVDYMTQLSTLTATQRENEEQTEQLRSTYAQFIEVTEGARRAQALMSGATRDASESMITAASDADLIDAGVRTLGDSFDQTAQAVDHVSSALTRLTGNEFFGKIAGWIRLVGGLRNEVSGLLRALGARVGGGASGGAAGGAGAGAGGAAGAGAGVIGAVAGAAALTAGTYGIGRAAIGLVSPQDRYTVEDTQRRFPGAGQGGGKPPDIVLQVDGREMARVTSDRLPELADQDGW